MPVFDFNDTTDAKNKSICTYTTFQSSESDPSPEKPIMLLDNTSRKWEHYSCGVFTNPVKRTSFEFDTEEGTYTADILQIDSRFVSLLKWRYIVYVKLHLEEAQSFQPKMVFYSL